MAWAASSAILVLVTGVATLHLLRMIRDLARPSTALGDGGLALVLGCALGGLVVLATAWWMSRGVAGRTVGLQLLAAVALTIAVRATLAIAFDAPLAAENAVIHAQAVGVLEGTANCCFSHRPMGYPLALAAMYGLLGIGPQAIEALNIALAAVTTLLVFDIARIAWNPRAGILAATAYAIMPSQALMALPPLTEPLYTMIVAAAVRLALSSSLPAAAALGVVLAVAQYVRSTAVALIAPVTVLYFAFGASIREPITRTALTVAAFVIAMAPVISFNLASHGDLSISTSAYGGWSLFVGANQESSGRFNAEDSALFAQMPGDTAWERSKFAGSLAVDRILDDPEAYLMLQPRKFAVMWRDETYAGAYAFAPAGSSVPPATAMAWLLSQIFYVPALALASLGILRHGRSTQAALLIGMIVAAVALSHLVLEVHSRYHAYVIPLVLVLASGAATSLVGRDPGGSSAGPTAGGSSLEGGL